MSSGILHAVGKVASIAAGPILGSILGGGSKKKDAAPVAPAPGPVVMPLADDAAVSAARKRSLLSQMSRGGRQSTILTDTSSGSSKLGG